MWTSDPSNSLIVANPAHGQAQKITPANDGGFFISWLDQEQGYSLYLQRLDALGNLLLPLSSPTSAGILVYQRVVPYSTDYGVTIDSAGNVIFGIDSGIQHADGSSDVGGNAVACKVSPEGELLFGSTGIIVSSEGENIGGDVHCTATNDGGVVFGWGMGEYFSTQFTKISHTGAIAWSTSLTRPSPELQISLNSIASSDNGSVIVSFFINEKPQGSSYNSPGDLLTQKLDGADGSHQWSEPVYIYKRQSYNETGVGPRGEALSVNDGDVNVYFATPAQDGESDAIYVQGVNYDGVTLFPENGTLVSTNIDAHKTEPVIGFNQSSVYVAWNSREPLQYVQGDHSAVFIQLVNNTGQRLWGDNGLQLEDYFINNGGSDPIAIMPAGNDVLIAWIPAFSSQTPGLISNITTALLDENGSYVWDGQTVDVKNNATSTYTPGAAKSTGNNFVAISWLDDYTPLRAQNIDFSGKLG